MQTSDIIQAEVFSVNDKNFEQEVLQSDLPVIVDFWASWCIHCQRLAPIYQSLSSEFKGKLRFAAINADENESTPFKYNVQGLPTLLIFKNGKESARIIGPHPSQLKLQITKSLQEN